MDDHFDEEMRWDDAVKKVVASWFVGQEKRGKKRK